MHWKEEVRHALERVSVFVLECSQQNGDLLRGWGVKVGLSCHRAILGDVTLLAIISLTCGHIKSVIAYL